MNETDTTMTKPTTETEFYTMLQHLRTSVRKTQIHLIAYSEEKASEIDVPDMNDYNYEDDRATTNMMLAAVQGILDHLEQHRTTYYPNYPAFEDTNSDTNSDISDQWGYTRRVHNASLAAAWVCTASQLSQAYAWVQTKNAPANTDLRKLSEEIDNLLGNIDKNNEAYSLGGNVDFRALLGASYNLNEMNPNYEAWALEAYNANTES